MDDTSVAISYWSGGENFIMNEMMNFIMKLMNTVYHIIHVYHRYHDISYVISHCYDCAQAQLLLLILVLETILGGNLARIVPLHPLAVCKRRQMG